MLDAAAKALSQMASPPFRTVLLKSMGLAAVLLIVVGIALHRLIAWLAGGGEAWLEGTIGPSAHLPLAILFWILAIVAALDRKSTRLNSSHLGISYAVFCLKNKRQAS